MAGTETKPVVRYVIFEAADASLWAGVPQFGIKGWTWCVGGGQTKADNEMAVGVLRNRIGKHCRDLVDSQRDGAIQEERGLARQVVELGFELVEDNSIPTY